MSDTKYWTRAHNPILGCREIAETCRGQCWAARVVHRMEAAGHVRGAVVPHAPLVEYASVGVLRWTGAMGRTKNPATLPARGRAHVIAINWLGDLFRDEVPEDRIMEVLDDIADNAEARLDAQLLPHAYLLLTHRPARMVQIAQQWRLLRGRRRDLVAITQSFWWGATITRASMLGAGMEIREIPGHHWLSIEPIEEGVGLGALADHLDWVTAGTSTTEARLCGVSQLAAIDDLVRECAALKLPLWVKQAGAPRAGHGRLAGMPRQMPVAISNAFRGGA